MVLGLTVYAFVAKRDFTIMGGIAFCILAVFVIAGLFTYWFGPTLRLVYCVCGVLLFVLYLVIDTQMIAGGKTYELSQEDYILGAIILYIDIVNIFIYVL